MRAKGFPDSVSITGSDPPEHQRFRMLAMKVFSPRRFALLEKQIYTLVHKLIDGFIGDGKADLQRQFATPLPLIVIADLLGVDHAEAVHLQRWSDDWVEAMGADSKPLTHMREIECAQSLTDLQLYFSDKIKQRSANPGDDSISDLIRANNALKEPVEHMMLIDMLRIFLVGGNETTALAIGSMMYHLLARRERFERLRNEPALIPKTIEEALRFESPSQWTGRNTTAETVLGGVTIPAGARVYLNWGAANRDSSKFPNAPDEFIQDRVTTGQVAFGFGPHFCIGSPLARMELRISLEVFVARLKNLRLADSLGPHFNAHSILRGLSKLDVEFDPA
jgi:cytochrome P450